MATSQIRMGHPYGQTPPNVYSDFDWIHEHKKELIEKYGECHVIVYQQQVLGVGATYKEALENAERDLPSDMGEITPVHDWVGYRHPFFRVALKATAKNE
jgi:tetrahydromethanopterin S-methyltransferase subunit H